MTKFLKPDHPLLRKIAQEIPQDKINSLEMKKIALMMLKIIQAEQKKHQKGVGLAAPQIGILKRIILVDVAADGKGRVGDLRIYINPKIIWVSKQVNEWYEGCYSTGKVCGIVSRPIAIKIQAFTITTSFPLDEWERRLEKHTGYTARIFQHEIDHLDGKVFVTHIENPDKLHLVKPEEFSIYRDKEAWRHWPKKCPFEKWQNIQKPLAYTKSEKV